MKTAHQNRFMLTGQMSQNISTNTNLIFDDDGSPGGCNLGNRIKKNTMKCELHERGECYRLAWKKILRGRVRLRLHYDAGTFYQTNRQAYYSTLPQEA